MFSININKKKIIAIIAITWSLFQLYTGFVGILAPLQQRTIHVTFAIMITFLLKPISKKLDKDKLYIDQIIAVILMVIIGYYITSNHMALSLNIGKYTSFEIILGIICFVLVIEGARRLTGMGLVSIALVFIAYSYFGKYMPGLIRHPGSSFTKIMIFQSLTTEGIFGVAIEVSASFIFLFILYAQFLQHTGGGQIFIDLASAAVGTVRGGPAKVAVIGSCLFGSISGSAVANVAGTGTFTIPMMKKNGYSSSFAGAVEAVASSGGQFMPPIMGSSAFLMSEILGLPYWKIALYALVPAVLYYVAVFIMVDLRAVKQGLKGLPKEQLPIAKEVLKEGWPALISPVVLVFLLAGLQWSPAKSAVWAIVVTVITSMFSKKTRLSIKDIIKILEDGGIAAIETAVVCAAVGVVVGAITQTGLALKLSTVLVTVAQGNLVILLFLTMIASIIFGMGLPTVACYLILAVMVAPALMQMGVLPIAAHLFIFYFGIISNITPPVALASFVAAGIAEAPFMKTGFEALKLGISAFILPFMFVFNPALILNGTLLEIIPVVITATIGIYSLSVFIEGIMLQELRVWERLAFGVTAILLIFPENLTDIIGIIGFLALVSVQYMQRKKMKSA